MDLFEKLFQKVSNSSFLSSAAEHSLHHHQISKYLDLFANSFSLDPVSTVAGRTYVGAHGGQIFVPEKISFFKNSGLNKKLYVYVVLQILGARRLGLAASQNDNHGLNGRLDFLTFLPMINRALDMDWPGYPEFQLELLRKMDDSIPKPDGRRAEIHEHWHRFSRLRSNSRIPLHENLRRFRHNEAIPDYLYVSTPLLEPRISVETKCSPQPGPTSQREKSNTEVKKTYSDPSQAVDLEKEQQNPIMHSFEKTETADEYRGGRKMDSGDDELADHSHALDELALNRVTRGGEAAKSTYQSESAMEHAPADGTLISRADTHFYPEWSFKKNRYLKDYCRLIENPLSLQLTESDFAENLLNKNRTLIARWRSQLQSLFNQTLWKKRVLEGDEIDLDALVSDFACLLHRKNVNGRWYMHRRPQAVDVEIYVLFDQSLSSDSYVQNRRVLDVTLEAIGLSGLLFDRILDRVTVAGTWSATRHNCAHQIYKEAQAPWTQFWHRAHQIEPQGYTRLGPAIRHAIAALKKSASRRKLLILLTDGKPTDLDGYEGATGIHDVAQACREAEIQGIYPLALIVDHKQKSHFSKMFKRYLLLSAENLPSALFTEIARSHGM